INDDDDDNNDDPDPDCPPAPPPASGDGSGGPDDPCADSSSDSGGGGSNDNSGTDAQIAPAASSLNHPNDPVPGSSGGTIPHGLHPNDPIPSHGMPVWRVSEPYITLWLHDTPLFYRSSTGQRVELRLSYKHRAAGK